MIVNLFDFQDLEIAAGNIVPDSPEAELAAPYPPPPQKPLPPPSDAPAVAEWLERPLSEAERVNLLESQTDRGTKAKRAAGGGGKKRKRTKKDDPNTSSGAGADEIVESKESIDALPVDDLLDGEERTVPGSKGDVYNVKREGNKITCTCKAFQFQTGKMETKTCKHIQSIRGLAAEIARTGRQLNGKGK